MNTITPARRVSFAALCTALCVVLPVAFHAIPGGGNIFLPMHIPVLLCGMVCGWPWGLMTGLTGPLLSSMITGMPAAAVLPGMMVECAVYGLVSGLLLRFLRTGNTTLDLYIALLSAMLAGRILSGAAKALIFTPGLTMSAWIAASFVTALPGIAVQLILLPMLVRLLIRTRQIPDRYEKEKV